MPFRFTPVEHDPWATPVVFGGEKGAGRAGPAGPGMPLAKAQELAKSGADADTIFQSTGWYRGPDSQWKFVLSDKGASLNPDFVQTYTEGRADTKMVGFRSIKPGTKLSEVYNHPDLYRAYPELKDVKIESLPPGPGGSVPNTTGSYDPNTNTLSVAGGRPIQDVLATIAHETQHRIQHLEGFGQGANVTEFYPSDVGSKDSATQTRMAEEAFNKYRSSAGEVESRQAEKQIQLNNWDQRPTAMEGFPKASEQLVRREYFTPFTPGVQHQAFRFTPVEHDPWATPVLFGGDKGAERLGTTSSAEARGMEGKSSNEIYHKTGWYQGPDGQWKWVMSDKGASLNLDNLRSDKAVPLSQVLDHPDLYQAYPEFKNYTVQRMEKEAGVTASFNPAKKHVQLSGTDKDKMLGSLLHEVQHGIQETEGFGQGGNQDLFYPRGFYKNYAPITQAFSDAVDQYKEAGGDPYLYKSLIWNQLGGEKLSSHNQAFVDQQKANLPADVHDSFVKAATDFYAVKQWDDATFEKYRNLAGEVEARQVEGQLKNQDWSQPPMMLRGFPPAQDQIIRMKDDKTTTFGRQYEQDQPISFIEVDHDPWKPQGPTPSDYAPAQNDFRLMPQAGRALPVGG